MAETLYETDLAEWALTGADMLRRGMPLTQDHRDQLAEELESMAANARRELQSRGATLITHLLKIRFQPDKQTRSWDLTVAVQRKELDHLLQESPSLKRTLIEKLDDLYTEGRQYTEIETGLKSFPQKNPFTLDEILNG